MRNLCLNYKKGQKNFLFTGLHPKNYFNHGNLFMLPMIEILELDSYDLLDKEIFRIKQYSSLIVTSSFSVEYFFRRVQCISNIKYFKHLKVFSIGRHTTQSLMKFGLNADFEPEEDSSEGLLSLFKKRVILGENILIPRSNLAKHHLPNELKKLGNSVNTVTAYRNVYPTNMKKLNVEFFDGIIFTSPSGVDNFIKTYGVLPNGKKVISRGRETQKRVAYYTKG